MNSTYALETDVPPSAGDSAMTPGAAVSTGPVENESEYGLFIGVPIIEVAEVLMVIV